MTARKNTATIVDTTTAEATVTQIVHNELALIRSQLVANASATNKTLEPLGKVLTEIQNAQVTLEARMDALETKLDNLLEGMRCIYRALPEEGKKAAAAKKAAKAKAA